MAEQGRIARRLIPLFRRALIGKYANAVQAIGRRIVSEVGEDLLRNQLIPLLIGMAVRREKELLSRFRVVPKCREEVEVRNPLGCQYRPQRCTGITYRLPKQWQVDLFLCRLE